jgi:uncharacterized protein (UPF0548 family)
MYLLTRPTDKLIKRFIASQQEKSFSYAEIGASHSTPPSGYRVDHNRVCLGMGAETFEHAKAAIYRWEMFHLDWVQLYWPDAPIKTGTTVGVMARALGVWSLNASRVVYVIEKDGPIERFGFAYGTLPDHAERGEERFSVEWHHQDDTVWYDLLAFSQPNQLLSKIAYPYARKIQKRFAIDSMQAMVRAVSQ